MSDPHHPPVPPSPPPCLPPEALAVRLQGPLQHWQVEGGQLCRTLATSGWPATLMLANAVAHLAEAAWHHPDLHLSYPRLRIALSTHESGGITERDLALATRIEQVLSWPADAVLSGPPPTHRLWKPE